MFFSCNKIIFDLVIFWLCLQVVLFKNYNIHHLKFYMQFFKKFFKFFFSSWFILTRKNSSEQGVKYVQS